MCSEDAEETLYELGFGCDEPQVTVRIPPRFLTFPSQGQGINFRLFLDSQLRRIREEDPSLSLISKLLNHSDVVCLCRVNRWLMCVITCNKSGIYHNEIYISCIDVHFIISTGRFRQVQVLTAMANVFYSLYSHVSRTPLQKLATPEFTFSSSPVERIERFRSSVRSEPRSPVERLKDTVSKMCLYTGGSPRGSDSTSPQRSPRKSSSLPEVVDIVLEQVKTGANKKLDLGECSRSNSPVDDGLVTDSDKSCNRGEEVQTQKTVADTDILQNGNKICHNSKQTDNVENSIKPADLDSRTHSVRTSVASTLSGETVIETDHQCVSSQSDTRTADLKPVAKVTYDLICPQIVESVHQAPFCSQHTQKANTLPPISSERDSTDRSRPGSHIQTAVSEPDARQLHASRSATLDGSYTQCCITVSGWEGDDGSSRSSNTPDSGHTSAVTPVQTCEESFNKGKSPYLKPQTHCGLGHGSNNLQQVNSFELEEVRRYNSIFLQDYLQYI